MFDSTENTIKQNRSGVKCYHLVRHIKPNVPSRYPPKTQIVAFGKTEADVEAHLERIQKLVHMPSGCTYSIEFF